MLLRTALSFLIIARGGVCNNELAKYLPLQGIEARPPVIIAQKNVGAAQCALECYHDDSCKSFAADVTNNVCQLISALHSAADELANPNFTWYNEEVLQTDCLDWYNEGSTVTGVYTIWPIGFISPFEVRCDMDNGGGWTVIQRRFDGSVTFWNQLWEAYKNGFGSVMDEHWLGNDKIHFLTTKDTNVTLRTELYGDRCSANCDFAVTSPLLTNGVWFDERGFHIDNEASMYTFHASPSMAGNATAPNYQYDSMDGLPFTTVDVDNDVDSGNCASLDQMGGWWHYMCSFNPMNGKYSDTNGQNVGMMWMVEDAQYFIVPVATELKIRRVDD